MELMDKLREIEKSYKEIEARMAEQEVANDPQEMQSLGKKHVDLTPIVDAFMKYEAVIEGIKDAEEMISGDDREMAELAKEEIPLLESQAEELEKQKKYPDLLLQFRFWSLRQRNWRSRSGYFFCRRTSTMTGASSSR